MKRLLSILLTLIMLLTIVGCKDTKDPDNSSKVSKPSTSSETDNSDDDTSSEDDESFDTPSKDSGGEIIDETENDKGSDDKKDNKDIPLREKLQGGINFEGFNPTNPNSYIFNRTYYDLLVQSGFDHIRLPFGASNYLISDAPDYLLDTSVLRMLDVALANGIDAGLVMVLDFHHSNYKTNPTAFKKIWRQLAERYQDWPEELMFEIMNEPNGVSDSYVNSLQLETVKIIRETNPTRTLALAANNFNHTNKLYNVEIPTYIDEKGNRKFDENVMISIHNYVTMPFTHQGANWSGNNYPGQQIFTDDIKNKVTEYLEICAKYEKQTGRTVWISEWGIYLGKVIKEEVTKYVKHFSSECARLDLAYAYWEFNSGFGAFDNNTQQWKDYVYGALVTRWKEV